MSPAFRLRDGDREILTAVHIEGTIPEDPGAFARRLHEQRLREHSGYGLLSEWQRRLSRLPIAAAAHQRVLAAVEAASRFDGPAAALTGVGEVSYSELTPRRDAPFEVFSGTTPPGSFHDDAVALHAHRVGDTLDIVLTARGGYAERTSAAELLDLVLDALPR